MFSAVPQYCVQFAAYGTPVLCVTRGSSAESIHSNIAVINNTNYFCNVPKCFDLRGGRHEASCKNIFTGISQSKYSLLVAEISVI